MSEEKKAVLVTTKRGVFFGYLVGAPTPEKVTLTECRMVVYWTGSRGVLGLAKDGPNAKCRVSPPAPRVDILGSQDQPITLVALCTDGAVEAFEAGPWG